MSPRNRALFWPAVLILLGVFALLVNLGAISTDRLYRLGDLWPVLIVILGLELLINRMRLPSTIEATASVLVVVVALVGATLYVALGPALPAGSHTKTFTEADTDLQNASLEVDVGAATVSVEGSNSLVKDLFQAQVTYSGPQPKETFDQNSGRVVISQESSFWNFGTQHFKLDIRLNSAVTWAIVVNSGASTNAFDLSNMPVKSIELNTGASTDTLSLPRPQGSVPIQINGGALTVHMHRHPGTAAAVDVSGGGISLDFDGHHFSGVGELQDSTSSASDIFQVDVSGGACTVTMDTSGLD